MKKIVTYKYAKKMERAGKWIYGKGTTVDLRFIDAPRLLIWNDIDKQVVRHSDSKNPSLSK